MDPSPPGASGTQLAEKGTVPFSSGCRIENAPLEPDPVDTGGGSADMKTASQPATSADYGTAFPNSRKVYEEKTISIGRSEDASGGSSQPPPRLRRSADLSAEA